MYKTALICAALLACTSLAAAQDGTTGSVGNAGAATPSATVPPGTVPPNGGEVQVPGGEVPVVGSADGAQAVEGGGQASETVGQKLAEAPASDPMANRPEAVSNRSPISAEYEDVRDWRVECYDPAINGVRCQILQQVINRQARQPLAIMSLAYLPESDRTGIEVVVPLGFKVSSGIRLAIGGFTDTLPVDSCTRSGCVSRTSASRDLIANMAEGAAGTIALIVSETETFRIPFSLNGFSQAYSQMRNSNEAYAAARVN